MVLTEGWDMPEVGCCILARPTKKMGLYRQMIGRVLRPADGKPDAIVLDHSGAVFRHGFVEDPVEWTLDPDRHAESPTHQQRERTARHRACSNARNAAPSASPASRASIADSCRSGRRAPVPFQRRRSRPGRSIAPRQRQRLRPGRARTLARHADLRSRSERDYKPGWAAHKYKEKFGTWPPWGATPEPIPPTPEVPLMGALAHDRLCAEAGRMKRKRRTDQRPIRPAHDRDAALAGHARA